MSPAKKAAKKSTKKATKKAAAKKATKKATKKTAKKATKRTAKKAAAKRTASSAPIASKTRVKEAAGDLRVSSDFYEALDAEIRSLIDKAAQRAQSNGRSTLRPGDL